MAKPEPRSENIVVSLLCNVGLPALILGKGDDWLTGISPASVLLLALAFPTGYFLYDLRRRHQANILSIIGFLGTLASGGLGLLKLDPFWIAVKEAAVPLIIGAVVFISEMCKRPLLRMLFINDAVLDTTKIHAAVNARGNGTSFEEALRRTGLLLALSFLFSGIVNYLLARGIVHTHPEENAVLFNQELGKMALWSWPVIALPMMVVFMVAFFGLLKKLRELSGLSDEEIFRSKS